MYGHLYVIRTAVTLAGTAQSVGLGHVVGLPVTYRYFSLLRSVQAGYTQSAAGASSADVRWQCRTIDNSSQSNAEAKNERNYTSIPHMQ